MSSKDDMVSVWAPAVGHIVDVRWVPRSKEEKENSRLRKTRRKLESTVDICDFLGVILPKTSGTPIRESVHPDSCSDRDPHAQSCSHHP